MSEEQNLQQKQDDEVLYRILDQQRWLMNNGLLNDMHKDQLYMYGAIVHKDIKAVELDIDVEKKTVSYYLYIDNRLSNQVKKFKRLSKSDGLFNMWRFKRLLEREGNLNFSAIIGRFVKDYCGPAWNSSVKLLDIKEYEDGYQKSESADKQLDS